MRSYLLFLMGWFLFLNYLPTQAQITVSDTFTYTDQIQTWNVPACVTRVRITAAGASGGDVNDNPGGSGAIVAGDFAVTPGETLSLIAAQKGEDGSASGGGGGASFVARTSAGFSGFLADSLLLIAGGGGGADLSSNGGSATGFQSTASGSGGSGSNLLGAESGGGASAEQNGGSTAGGQAAINGAQGGNGTDNGGFGGGGGTDGIGGGGGAGASGGNGNAGSGGSAGTSYNGCSNPVNSPAAHTGNGYVIIEYNPDACPPPPIPTMGQWALLWFGLFCFTLGLVVVWSLTHQLKGGNLQ